MNTDADPILAKLWNYNDWANRMLFDQFRAEAFMLPQNSLRLLSHIVNTQLVWLGRLNSEKIALGPWDVHELARCIEIHDISSAGLKAHLGQHPDSTVTYSNFQGVAYENSIQDILIHALNHGTYHRAQIARDLRVHGLEPINTDYITFIRSL